MQITTLNTYGVDFEINRQGLVEVTQNGSKRVLGETRSRLFMSAVILSSLIETEDGGQAQRMARLMDRLTEIVTGDLRGNAMRRAFDILHVLKIEAGDTDVTPSEISERLVMSG